MKYRSFICLVALAGLAVVVALARVLLSAANERTQQDLQARQQAINNGILGPQGQQISGAVLQDMARAASTNRDMRGLLGRYGYTVSAADGSAGKATTKGGGAK